LGFVVEFGRFAAFQFTNTLQMNSGSFCQFSLAQTHPRPNAPDVLGERFLGLWRTIHF
jgi:hypothetical protein